MSRLISLDSCAILHLLCKTPEWYGNLRRIHDDAVGGNLRLFISEISMPECTRLEVKGGPVLTAEVQAAMIDQFFHNTFIVRRAVTSRESELAAELVRTHGVGACDAIVAASAVLAGATELYTTDGCRPRRKAGKLITVGTVETNCGKAMAIRLPEHYK